MASHNVADFGARFGLKTDKESFLSAMILVEGLKVGLRAVGSVVREVTHQLVESTLGVYEHADALDDMATKAGVSAATLQELGYVGQFTDTSMESIATGLKFLQKNMVGAIEGNKELKQTFKDLGVSLVDSRGHLRKTEDVMMDLADRFADMPASAKKTDLMMKVFGKSAGELTGIFNLGSDGIREYTDEFRALGAELGEGTIADSAKFEDNLVRVKTAMQGVKNTIAEALLPTLNELAADTVEWVKANQAVIRTKVREWVEGAVRAIRQFVKDVRQWVDEQGGLNAILEKGEHWLKLLGIAFAVFKTVEFAGAIGKAIEALQAIKLAIASNPLGLLAVLMATAVTMWVENWEYMSEFFLMIWDGIVGGIDAAVKAVGESIDWIVRKITGAYEAVKRFVDWANPFNIEDNSTSGVRGTGAPSPALDAAIAMARNPALGVTAPQLVERGTGGGNTVSVHAPMSFAITQQPGQDAHQLAKLVGEQVDERLNRTMREARGGL